jgi:hypothetical protein
VTAAREVAKKLQLIPSCNQNDTKPNHPQPLLSKEGSLNPPPILEGLGVVRDFAITKIPFIMYSSLEKKGEYENIDSRKEWYRARNHGVNPPSA